MAGQVAATRGLARLLNPVAGDMQPVISQLSRSAGEADAQVVRDGLRAAGGWLKRDTVRVTFGGYFSSGKSSLLNMLLGTSLLPVSDDPETGVPCLLRSGTANRVVAHTSSGTAEVSFSTEAIAGYVSLIGADGDYREEVRAVRELDITLATAAIPSGVVWADSPGINDTAATTQLATRVARDSDVLVWVVNSRQPFSLTEQAFVRAHMAECGPASVVFVVNVFLPSDTPEVWAWQAFLEQRARSHRIRISENVATEAGVPRVVFTSARAAARNPQGFGGPAAGALIASVSDAAAPAVLADRLFRAEAEVRRVTDELAARANAAEKRLGQARAIVAEQQKARARQREAFLAAASSAVSAVFARHGDTAAACAAEVAATTSGKLQPAATYAQRLTSKLSGEAEKMARELVHAINACASAHEQTPLSQAAANEITGLLLPPAVTITAASASSDVVAPAVEAVLGDLIGPVIGAALFGKRRKAIQQQLTAAGAAAATVMLAARPWVLAVAERCCMPRTPPPASPDESRLWALRMARATLAKRVLEPLTTGLASWQQIAWQEVA